MWVLRNTRDNTIIGDRIGLADTWESRYRGLLGRAGLAEGEGLIITSCNSVHSFGMRFAFDVLFLDSDKTVVSFASDVGPSRNIDSEFPAEYAVELPAGTIKSKGVKVGDRLQWQEDSKPSSSFRPGLPRWLFRWRP
ncbi:MAG: DUF192 domain-containing protein [Firmicutes bacterium]|nr:DUF192 domain-containing protein [Bacillota bacterium]